MKIYSLHLLFALYVFVISARSIVQVTTDDHSDSIVHITALLTVAFLLLGSTAILPDSPPPVALSIDDEPVLLGLWYTLLGLYTVGCILAYSTPLGPPLHYPPSDIYSEKTVKSITNADEENVCGTRSRLLFLLFRVLMTSFKVPLRGIFYYSHIRPRSFGLETSQKASILGIYL